MAIGIESLLFLLGGLILALVLVKAFGRGANDAKSRGGAQIKLERTLSSASGVEETRLLINDRPILVASSAGVRLADYADEVEQLETIATHMAAALDVTVELTRVPTKSGQPEEAVPVRRLPRNQQDGTAL